MGEVSLSMYGKPNMRAERCPVKSLEWPFLKLGLWLSRRAGLQS